MSKENKVVSPWGKGTMRALRALDLPPPEPTDTDKPAPRKARAKAEVRNPAEQVRDPANSGFAGRNLPAEISCGIPQNNTAAARKSDRRPADHQRLSLWFPEAKLREWKVFAAQAGLTLTAFLDLAASRMIEDAASRSIILRLAHDDHDDLMIWKTDDDIIRRYRELTGNKWKPADDRLAQEFNDVNPIIVEIGMVMALFRTKAKRINSFNYFLNPIREAIEETTIARMGEQSLREYLQYAHSKLAAKRKETDKGGDV